MHGVRAVGHEPEGGVEEVRQERRLAHQGCQVPKQDHQVAILSDCIRTRKTYYVWKTYSD